MKEFEVDYKVGESDNVKRLQAQLKTLRWWQFSKRYDINIMICMAISTDYQEKIAEINENTRKMEAAISRMSCTGKLKEK